MPDRSAPADFAARLRALRSERKLSQQRLAEIASLSISTVRQLEQGHIADPGLSTLCQLADALGVSLEAFR